MTSTRKFILAAMVTATAIVGAYAYAWNYQFGAPLEGAYDVAHWEILKDYAADHTPGQRVLVAGDSNVLFGLDSDAATKALGVQTLNLGLHAGLPLNRILEVAERNVRPGDTVVLPLWWGYYVNDYRVPNDWYTDQMIAWDSDFFDRLPFLLKLRYVAAVSPMDLYDNIEAQNDRAAILKKNPWRTVLTPVQAMATWKEYAPQQKEFAYSYLNMTSRGDIRHTCGVHYAAKGADYALAPGWKPSKASMDYFEGVVRDLEDKGATVYVVAPVMVDDATSRSAWMTAVTKSIWDELRTRRIKTLGAPDTFMFPASAFFNTSLHLNCVAAEDRTRRLVNLLAVPKPSI